MKRLVLLLALVSLALVALACAPAPTVAPTSAPATAAAKPTTAPAQATNTTAAAKPSIKIGIIAPTTGTFAANGQSMINGWKLWWDKNGYTVAGRQVEMFYEDDAATPDTTLTKARLLNDQRQVHMMVGPLSAATGLALAGYAKGIKIPVFFPIVSADDLTQRARVPNVIRIAGWTLDPDTADPIELHVYIDGGGFNTGLANLSRPDVAAASIPEKPAAPAPTAAPAKDDAPSAEEVKAFETPVRK